MDEFAEISPAEAVDEMPEAPTEKPLGPVRRSMRAARENLTRSGTYAPLLTSLLFCLLVTFAWVVLAELLSLAQSLLYIYAQDVWSLILLEVVYYLLIAASFLAGVLPAWLARLRMAGRALAEIEIYPHDVLYYYTSRRRFGRTIVTGLFLVFEVAVPAFFFFLALLGGFAVCDYGFDFLYAGEWWAIALNYLIGALAMLLLLFLSGFYHSFAALVVGNERLPVWRAFFISLPNGARNLGKTFRFTLLSLWHLLLSLLTVGVAYFLWYSHHFLLSYLDFSKSVTSPRE
jgi:hypothetical protein